MHICIYLYVGVYIYVHYVCLNISMTHVPLRSTCRPIQEDKILNGQNGHRIELLVAVRWSKHCSVTQTRYPQWSGHWSNHVGQIFRWSYMAKTDRLQNLDNFGQMVMLLG